MPERASIRARALGATLATLALAALLTLPLVFWLTLDEMDEVFDERLQQVALAVAAATAEAPRQSQTSAAASSPTLGAPSEPDDVDFVTEIWALEGPQRLYSTQPHVRLPFGAKAGAGLVQVDGRSWHLHRVISGGRLVQAAQPTDERVDLAVDAALQLGAALLAAFAAIAAVLAWQLRRAFASLDAATAALAGRSATALDPLPADEAKAVPAELVPLVTAIDGLLARLAEAMASQRRFVADAAHELRTPVTALQLQLDWLQRASDDAGRAAALAELGQGIRRTQRLVTQLLDLERAGPDAPLRIERVDLGALLQSVAAERSPALRARGLAVEVQAPPGLLLQADRDRLETLLRNLLGNVLHHARGAQRVVLAAARDAGAITLSVSDDGPGIAPAERERVFERFYRRLDNGDAAGSGLGLAIVAEVARRHGARVRLGDGLGGPNGRGVRVDLIFPLT